MFREACCGTHVHNTGVLQHFSFLTYTSKGATNRIIKAVAGPKALHMKQVGEKMWNKITELENTLHSGELTYEVFNAKINRIKEEINDQHAQVPLPHLIKKECLMHLENLSKAKWLREKEIEKSVSHHTSRTSNLCVIQRIIFVNAIYL